MFCVIYKFRIIEGKREQFVTSWAEVTRAFITYGDALGSRLHQSDDQNYIAYAQWPSKEIRDKAELPEEIRTGPYEMMRSSCDSIEVLYELYPVSDHLKLVRAVNNG